jgi:hypothetical protein
MNKLIEKEKEKLEKHFEDMDTLTGLEKDVILSYLEQSHTRVIAEIVERIKGMKKEEPKDIYDGEDLFPRKYNQALEDIIQELTKQS